VEAPTQFVPTNNPDQQPMPPLVLNSYSGSRALHALLHAGGQHIIPY
jgi:hypothetical protein